MMKYNRLTKWQKKISLWQKMADKKIAHVKKKQYLCSVKENIKILLLMMIWSIIAITIGMIASYILIKFTNLI